VYYDEKLTHLNEIKTELSDLTFKFFFRNFVDIRVVVGQGILDILEEEEMVFEIENVELHPSFE